MPETKKYFQFLPTLMKTKLLYLCLIQINWEPPKVCQVYWCFQWIHVAWNLSCRSPSHCNTGQSLRGRMWLNWSKSSGLGHGRGIHPHRSLGKLDDVTFRGKRRHCTCSWTGFSEHKKIWPCIFREECFSERPLSKVRRSSGIIRTIKYKIQ